MKKLKGASMQAKQILTNTWTLGTAVSNSVASYVVYTSNLPKYVKLVSTAILAVNALCYLLCKAYGIKCQADFTKEINKISTDRISKSELLEDDSK